MQFMDEDLQKSSLPAGDDVMECPLIIWSVCAPDTSPACHAMGVVLIVVWGQKRLAAAVENPEGHHASEALKVRSQVIR